MIRLCSINMQNIDHSRTLNKTETSKAYEQRYESILESVNTTCLLAVKYKLSQLIRNFIIGHWAYYIFSDVETYNIYIKAYIALYV
jgi:hypothetical protein